MCFTGKYTARPFHTKLHPGPEWRISRSDNLEIERAVIMKDEMTKDRKKYILHSRLNSERESDFLTCIGKEFQALTVLWK